MRSLVHNRVELIEAYAEARRPVDGGRLDVLFTAVCKAVINAARAHFGGNIEAVVQLDRREGSGAGPVIRTTILTGKPAAWFPRHRSLSETAGHIARIGKLFARDVTGHLAAALATPGKTFVRQEVRRKAPGKLLDLIDRIAPAEMLNIERMTDLATREREWLADDIANLRRAVHADAHFTRLMSQLKRETHVAFLPTTTLELKTLSRKLVGIPTGEGRLRRRKVCPAFADPKHERPLHMVAMKCALSRQGALQSAIYYSD